MPTNRMPSFNLPLIDRGTTSKDWYFFWVGLFKGVPQGFVDPVTIGASPYEYTAPTGGTVIVSGGTVSLIRFSRDGTTYYDVGATAGMFPVGASDLLEITYSAPPSVTFVPS